MYLCDVCQFDDESSPFDNLDLTSPIDHLSVSTTLAILPKQCQTHSIVRSIGGLAWLDTDRSTFAEVVECSTLYINVRIETKSPLSFLL